MEPEKKEEMDIAAAFALVPKNDKKRYAKKARKMKQKEANAVLKNDIRSRRRALNPFRLPSTSKIALFVAIVADCGGILWVMKLMYAYPEYAISSGLYTLIGIFATLTASITAYYIKSATDHKNGVFDGYNSDLCDAPAPKSDAEITETAPVDTIQIPDGESDEGMENAGK